MKNLVFVKAVKENDLRVEVTYTLDLVTFYIFWEREDTDHTFDLQTDCISSSEILSERVKEAIDAGESDKNKYIELYLALRDTFDSSACDVLEIYAILNDIEINENGYIDVSSIVHGKHEIYSMQMPNTTDSIHFHYENEISINTPFFKNIIDFIKSKFDSDLSLSLSTRENELLTEDNYKEVYISEINRSFYVVKSSLNVYEDSCYNSYFNVFDVTKVDLYQLSCEFEDRDFDIEKLIYDKVSQ